MEYFTDSKVPPHKIFINYQKENNFIVGKSDRYYLCQMFRENGYPGNG